MSNLQIICGRKVVEGRIGVFIGLVILCGGGGFIRILGLEGEVMIDVRVVRYCTNVEFLRRSVIVLIT